jgi:hypothetical protein
MNEPDNPDQLAAARGCINGVLGSAPIWVFIFVVIGVLLRWFQ